MQLFNFLSQIIDQLKAQLNLSNVILPEPLEGVNFEYGFNTNKLREIVEYWGTTYIDKWYQKREFHIGKYPLYATKIQG